VTRRRSNQCRFCTSRRCRTRIVTLGFDEIACSRHVRDLEALVDQHVLGVRLHQHSSEPLRRVPGDSSVEGYAALVANFRAELARFTQSAA